MPPTTSLSLFLLHSEDEEQKLTWRVPHQPDAVFVASDGMAFSALRALHTARVNVPDDIAVVGFDDLPFATSTHPSLTTVRQPIRRIGAMAAEILLDIIQTGTEPPRRIILPTELVIRQSCGALK
ncbi:MAG: substrate-binding domain-containing protein [Chloroflexi bacterium]|nr:substrate-binding domain-containing protein [Chloroflexota bacterium]